MLGKFHVQKCYSEIELSLKLYQTTLLLMISSERIVE